MARLKTSVGQRTNDLYVRIGPSGREEILDDYLGRFPTFPCLVADAALLASPICEWLASGVLS